MATLLSGQLGNGGEPAAGVERRGPTAAVIIASDHRVGDMKIGLGAEEGQNDTIT
jgi:hypothetical protein